MNNFGRSILLGVFLTGAFMPGLGQAESVYTTTHARELLTADRTYYVRTDGSDSNTGLANTAGGAFLTIQKALDVAGALDASIYNVTISVNTGTYTGTVVPPKMLGAGTFTLQGGTGTATDVVISTTSASAISVAGAGDSWVVKDLKVQTTTSGWCFIASSGGQISFSNVNFGACASGHMLAYVHGTILGTGNYAISGAAPYHWNAQNGSLIDPSGYTITITGTPAFSANFAYASRSSQIICNAMTFSGSATGSRYSVSGVSLIDTNGSGTTYLPGNASGTGTNTGASPWGLYQ